MSKKKILITGATGFIGSHLTELCVKKGFKVSAFDRYNPQYNLNCLNNSKYKKDINFIFGDIRDYDSVYKASKGMDIILHLAALIGIPYSYYSPMAYVKTNIEGTYNILEATKNLNIKQLIVTSTSETYGTAQKVPIGENHRLIGQSPYSASKISADQLAISYWTSFIKVVLEWLEDRQEKLHLKVDRLHDSEQYLLQLLDLVPFLQCQYFETDQDEKKP